MVQTQAGQAFASDQQSALAQRAADRTQAELDFAVGQRSDLAEREAARVQAAADDKLQAQGDRDEAHAQLVQGFKDAQARRTEAAQAAAGGLGQPVDDDSLGGALRGSIEAVRASAKDLHRQLYRAVDPDGTLAMVASPIGDAAQRIAGELRQNGADLSAAEAPLFRRAATLPDVATYGTVHQLDIDLSAAMSAERRSAGETPAWARLSQLKSAVKDAMTNAADNQAAHEDRLVQAGVMAPEDTIKARLRADFDAATPAPRIGTDVEAGRATGTDDGRATYPRAPGDPGAAGAQVSQGRDARPATGGQSLQADAGRAGETLAPLTVSRAPRPGAVDRSAPVAVDRDGTPLTLADVRERLGLPASGKGSNGSPMDRPTSMDDVVAHLDSQGQALRPGDDLGQFDRPFFYRWIPNVSGTPGGKSTRFATLQDNGRIRDEYWVHFRPVPENAMTGKGDYNLESHDRANRFDLTGGSRSDAFRIIGTVVDVAKQFAATSSKAKSIVFSADAAEPSRVKLYRKLADKIGGTENVQEGPVQYRDDAGKMHDAVGFKVDIPDSARAKPVRKLNQSDLPSLDDVAAHVHGEGQASDPRISAVAEAARSGADLPAEEYRGFRGAYRREEDGSQVVRLFKRADASTLPHELGHVFLDDLQRAAADPRVPEALRDDHQAVSWWLSNDGASPFTRDQHETFAKGFERYLADGRAPTPGLQGAFDRFKGWIQSIYRNLRRLGNPIPDEARAVLDRMLVGGGAGRATAPVRPAIADEFRSQALAAGVPADEADASARIASAYYHTRAETRGLGEDPAELFKSLRVEGTPGARGRAADRAASPEPASAFGEDAAALAPRAAAPQPEAPPREVGTGPRPDAPAFDPDGLRAPPKPDVPRPQDLRAFVRSRGGMRDTGGDLAAMGMPELIGKGPRAVDPDKMREAAAEAGYLGGDTARAMRETHPNDLMDALSGDRPVHSVRDEDAAAAWDAYDEARERYDAARGEFGTRSRFGVVPERAPLDSYSRDDIEGPSGPQMREPAASGLRPNFDGAADARLKAANVEYAKYKRTYGNPIVGPGLRTTGFSGDYQRTDAAFIRNAVKPGPAGHENAKAHLRAAKDDPEAVDAMHDAVLNPLRRAALGPGFLPPAALANWKSSYGPALRALDEVTPGFSARFDDAGRATQELLDMGTEHAAAAKAAQGEAARQAVLDDADRRTRLGQANAADREAVSNLLAERKANDRADAASDKASTSAAIAGRADADRDALARSKAETAEGIGRARDILREARATPAAQFAAKGGTGVASTEVENAVGGYLKTGTAGATRMRGLVQSVQDNPDALAGLRKAGTDWLVRSHTNADGSLSGGKLIQFLKNNGDSLRELYPHDQVSMMGAVARDAEIGARWRTTTAVKGGSDTVKNLLAAAAEGHGKGGHVTLGIVATEAVMQGFEHGGFMGAATGGAGAAALYMMNAMRQAGIRRTSDLYMAALADPELAHALISKMPSSPTAGPVTLFARQLRRAAILGPMAAGQSNAAGFQRRDAGAR